MAEETVGKLIVEVEARLTKLEEGMREVQRITQKAAKQVDEELAKPAKRWDFFTSAAVRGGLALQGMSATIGFINMGMSLWELRSAQVARNFERIMEAESRVRRDVSQIPLTGGISVQIADLVNRVFGLATFGETQAMLKQRGLAAEAGWRHSERMALLQMQRDTLGLPDTQQRVAQQLMELEKARWEFAARRRRAEAGGPETVGQIRKEQEATELLYAARIAALGGAGMATAYKPSLISPRGDMVQRVEITRLTPQAARDIIAAASKETGITVQ